MVVPREPVSLSGHFPGRFALAEETEAADSDVFICGIYKCQQPLNGERHDRSCFCCVSRVL